MLICEPCRKYRNYPSAIGREPGVCDECGIHKPRCHFINVAVLSDLPPIPDLHYRDEGDKLSS